MNYPLCESRQIFFHQNTCHPEFTKCPYLVYIISFNKFVCKVEKARPFPTLYAKKNVEYPVTELYHLVYQMLCHVLLYVYVIVHVKDP